MGLGGDGVAAGARSQQALQPGQMGSAASSNDTKVKCPVYKCEFKYASNEELDAHYKEAHADLVEMGLSLGQDAESGAFGGCIRDTLLTQIITFAVTNKEHFMYFQSDY